MTKNRKYKKAVLPRACPACGLHGGEGVSFKSIIVRMPEALLSRLDELKIELRHPSRNDLINTLIVNFVEDLELKKKRYPKLEKLQTLNDDFAKIFNVKRDKG